MECPICREELEEHSSFQLEICGKWIQLSAENKERIERKGKNFDFVCLLCSLRKSCFLHFQFGLFWKCPKTYLSHEITVIKE